jgi:hypothetical protein
MNETSNEYERRHESKWGKWGKWAKVEKRTHAPDVKKRSGKRAKKQKHRQKTRDVKKKRKEDGPYTS